MSEPHAVVTAVPTSLRERLRPVSLAGRRTLPVVDPLVPLFPDGLPRGVTVTVGGTAARSFAFALTAATLGAGSWLAVLGLGNPGWRAVAELGVPTERTLHIDTGGRDTGGRDTGGRDTDALAAALDGFDLVLVGSRIRSGSAVERRLAARARERGTVVIALHERTAHEGTVWSDRRPPGTGPFAAVADLRVWSRTDEWTGLGAGTGRLRGRSVEVLVEGKRLPGRRRTTRLWLPGPDGAVATTVDNPDRRDGIGRIGHPVRARRTVTTAGHETNPPASRSTGRSA